MDPLGSRSSSRSSKTLVARRGPREKGMGLTQPKRILLLQVSKSGPMGLKRRGLKRYLLSLMRTL